MRRVLSIMGVMLLAGYLWGQPKVEYHGLFYDYSFYWNNSDFDKNTKDSDLFHYLHFDFTVNTDFGKGIKLHTTFGCWGTFGTHAITGETPIQGGSPGDAVAVREGYITLENIGGTPLSFRFGKEHILYGDQIFDGGEDGFLGAKLFYRSEMIDADIFYYDLREGGGCAGVGAYPAGDTTRYPTPDWNLFGTWITAKVAGLNISPYAFYRVLKDDKPMWGGLRIAGAPISGLDLALEFAMMMGDNGAGVSYAGMHGMGKVSYSTGPISFGFAGLYFSGDDGTTTDKNEAYESPTWGPYTFGFYKWWPGFGVCQTLRSQYGFSLLAPWTDDVTNNIVIDVNAGYKMGDLSIRLDFFKYQAVWAPTGTDKDKGMEFDLLLLYKYSKTLDMGATFGYYLPGKYFAGEDPMFAGYAFMCIGF